MFVVAWVKFSDFCCGSFFRCLWVWKYIDQGVNWPTLIWSALIFSVYQCSWLHKSIRPTFFELPASVKQYALTWPGASIQFSNYQRVLGNGTNKSHACQFAKLISSVRLILVFHSCSPHNLGSHENGHHHHHHHPLSWGGVGMDSCIIRILFGGCSQGCKNTHTHPRIRKGCKNTHTPTPEKNSKKLPSEKGKIQRHSLILE